MNETETISTLKQGDQSALASLYDKYGAALYGVILRIVQTQEVAEEVTQETFQKIWRNAGSFDETKGKFYTWALNIARTSAIDTTRSGDFKHQQKTDNFDFLAYHHNHPSSHPEAETTGLREIVNRLDEKYRKVIDLAYFHGYTQSEIEQEMNIPIGTVKTRMRLAIRELRKIFSSTTT